MTNPLRDRRDVDDNYKEEVLRRQFAALRRIAAPRVDERIRKDDGWRWYCDGPTTLQSANWGQRQTTDSVLDTNALMLLLNALPLDGSDVGYRHPIGIPLAIRRRVEAARPFGFGAKLIVPLSVLMEAKGVLAKAPAVHDHAHQVLLDIAIKPDRPHWNIFSFEPLNAEVFDAFLHLHERLSASHVDRSRWPRLGDALVMAHGLVHGCPVASTEWSTKTEWQEAGVDSLFSFLVPR